MPPKANTFSSTGAKKRARAWQQAEKDGDDDESERPSESFLKLQRELEDREKVEVRNAKRQAYLDELVARTEGRSKTIGTLLYLDVELRKQTSSMAKLQSFITTGRLIFEVFDDLMPRTVGEAMIRLVKATGAQASGKEKTNASHSFFNSTFSYVVPGFLCRGGTSVTEENAAARTSFPGIGEVHFLFKLRLTYV
ncbi:hypothetical protein T492DRAFT_347786 [Pavlovales sp. CCMP2436]|nr:hypothetical protein T492DRAFT_347786 [Pavlovales sp. CCMP2436]